MRKLNYSLALLFTAACGGAEQPAPAAPAAIPEPAPAPVAAAPAPVAQPAPVPLPMALPGAARVACSWDVTAWKGNTLKLRLSPEGEPFATVNRPGAVKFTLPAGAATAAHVEVETVGVRVAARVAAAEIMLFAKAPEAIPQSTFVVGGGTQLNWEDGTPDELITSIPVRSANSAEPRKGLLKHVCAAYGLVPVDADPTGVIGNAPKGRVQFRENKRVGFELNRDGAKTRVAVPSRGGWEVTSEPTTAFVKVVGAVDLATWYKSEPLPDAPARDTRVPGWTDARCNTELQLIARAGKDAAVVGSIAKGAAFQVGPKADGYTRVGLPGTDLLLTDKGQFLVRSSDLEACNK